MRRIQVAAILLLAVALSGCNSASVPLGQNASFLLRSTEPRYQWRGDGLIGSTACRAGYEAGYGPAPSACMVDNVFAKQVASTSHLVEPAVPGPAYAAPAASAAHAYIYGDDGGAAGTPDARVARSGQQVDVPAEDAYRPAPANAADGTSAPEG